MVRQNIDGLYKNAIGGVYVFSGQTPAMRKNRTVWARVKEVLEERRLPATQHHAAQLAGVKQPSVAVWNKDGKFPEMEVAVRLSKKIGICVEWLLTERGPKYPGPPQQDPLAAKLWGLWDDMTEQTRDAVVSFAVYQRTVQVVNPDRVDQATEHYRVKNAQHRANDPTAKTKHAPPK